jgi:organic hydroperoxide reductase OsmC/OhrA
MSKHACRIVWKRESGSFDYDKYSRDHEWQFEGGIIVRASAAVAYKGNPDLVDPEAAFVGSLSACHMLTFLAVASMKKLPVAAYEDLAVGFLEKGAKRKLCITKVILKPVVTFDPRIECSEEIFNQMHEKAHQECFIANSVTTEIVVEPILK